MSAWDQNGDVLRLNTWGMNILFIGDIFGSPGRRIVADHLEDIQGSNQIDLTIANAENAAGGFGLTPAIVEDLFAMGIDVLTTGNHIWDKKEIFDYLPRQPRLAGQVIEDLLLIPDVVAGREHVDPHGEEILGDRRRQPEPARRILGVGDRQVDLIAALDILQMIRHDAPPRRPENVADE